MRKPPNNTNGTAINVSVTACGDSTVDRAKVKARYAAMTRQTAVNAKIHGGERSRSRSSSVFVALDAASVLTSPPTTGRARRASV